MAYRTEVNPLVVWFNQSKEDELQLSLQMAIPVYTKCYWRWETVCNATQATRVLLINSLVRFGSLQRLTFLRFYYYPIPIPHFTLVINLVTTIRMYRCYRYSSRVGYIFPICTRTNFHMLVWKIQVTHDFCFINSLFSNLGNEVNNLNISWIWFQSCVWIVFGVLKWSFK